MVVALLTLCLAAPGATGKPPRVPKGLEACTSSLRLPGPMPRAPGETLRYLVDVDGVSVGTIDLKIEQSGSYNGRVVTEYRSVFELDALVGAFVKSAGRAAALVPEGDGFPVEAMNDFTWGTNHYQEEATYEPDHRSVHSRRRRNGKRKEKLRSFNEPVFDFVSAFYAMRTMKPDTSGCSILYANQRAYTVWVTPAGRERVATPVGSQPADKYHIRIASERSRNAYDGAVWLGPGPDRVPYRGELQGKSHHMAARIHIYARGEGGGRELRRAVMFTRGWQGAPSMPPSPGSARSR